MMLLVLILGSIVELSLDGKYIFMGLAVGLLAALLFGFFLKKKNSKRQRNLKDIKKLLVEGEEVIVDGTAKYIKKKENVEGNLFLTGGRLIFTSPILIHQIDYILDDIEGIHLFKTWGVYNKGLTISIDGKEEKFEVAYPSDWEKIIKKQQEVNFF